MLDIQPNDDTTTKILKGGKFVASCLPVTSPFVGLYDFYTGIKDGNYLDAGLGALSLISAVGPAIKKARPIISAAVRKPDGFAQTINFLNQRISPYGRSLLNISKEHMLNEIIQNTIQTVGSGFLSVYGDNYLTYKETVRDYMKSIIENDIKEYEAQGRSDYEIKELLRNSMDKYKRMAADKLQRELKPGNKTIEEKWRLDLD